MNRRYFAFSVLFALLCGIIGYSFGYRRQAMVEALDKREWEADRAIEVQTAKTMPEWVAEQNSKKQKCAGLISDGGNNGYNSWIVKCVDGVRVYSDTTEEFNKGILQQEQQKQDLINAARTCILSSDQMRNLLAQGKMIFTNNMEPYFDADIEREFDELLLQQAQLKVIHAEGCKISRRERHYGEGGKAGDD